MIGDPTYTGTVPSLGGRFVSTLAGATASSLPAAAWDKTSATVGPFWGSDNVSLATVVAVTLVFAAAWYLLQGSGSAISGRTSLSRRWGILALVVIVLSWLGVTAIQSLTVKYQGEMDGQLGYVYNFYGAAMVAASLLVATPLLWAISVRAKWVGIAAVALIAVFATQQFAANVKLASALESIVPANMPLVHAYESKLPASAPERCAAVVRWRLHLWPEYYSRDIESRLSQAYQLETGYRLCPSLVPVDAVSPLP